MVNDFVYVWEGPGELPELLFLSIYKTTQPSTTIIIMHVRDDTIRHESTRAGAEYASKIRIRDGQETATKDRNRQYIENKGRQETPKDGNN